MEFLVQLIGIVIQQQGGNFTECSVSKFTCKPESWRERERERQQHPCPERFAKPWSGLKLRAAVFRS
ncbi:unnamed protein product [Musa acuminata subsp. malaccensis]|uniref:(wild Malaysian banana) hypothetical protein n=1 Tax=Musa acuminata subsp. malaccensis TaxID=214687 RepID=A0A804JXN5_MUSAM|nr:unnamed protein product [Musa acuminata subsp. malaccensis]